ncbi:MAG: glycosyltransferase [Deltaproteobacteria bacterium]|nr:glycosyltransferase [Deltaproteobacteria bacterium]
MQTEEKLIPFHTKDPTGRRVLVLAPHPDDETLGCGGSLALHAQAGDPVKILFLTNGAKGDSTGKIEKNRYMALRQKEAEKACGCIGVTELEFWPYEDRSLAGARGALGRMVDLLNDYRPQLVYTPSPLEIHPDHRAACFLLCDAVRGGDFSFEVAFYEVGQPICVNALVDITPVLAKKNQAINQYKSQLKERPYGEITMGLNRFRSMTLPEGVTHAEGFSWQNATLIQKIGPMAILSHHAHRLAPAPEESGPLVSIIVRTKDRPHLLANAIGSIIQQTYANLEIVVINDGGQDVADVLEAVSGDIPIRHVRHEKCRGRAVAANSGLKAARGTYFNFLDDDDVFYPDHVACLVNHLEMMHEKVAYSNVLNVYFSGSPETPGNRLKEERVFNFDFDPDRLLFENYIPIMSVLFSSEVLEQAKAFSEDLTLFEDWDFWIRVSRHFPFQHLDHTTAEYRFYGSTGMATAHRMKYRYDQARAMLFDRARPHMDGRAWAAYRKAAEMQAEPPMQPHKEGLNISIMATRLEETTQHLAALQQTQQQLHLNNTELALQIGNLSTPAVSEKPPLGLRRNLKAILNKARDFCCQKGPKRG